MSLLSNRILLISATALVAVAATKFYWPTVRIKQQEIETIKRDVVTVVREIVRPDGTKETISTITDKSKENKSVTLLEAQKPNWLISAGALYDVTERNMLYSASAQKRIAGPLSGGVQLISNQGKFAAGIVLTLEY